MPRKTQRRSAGLRPAVSQVFNLQGIRSAVGDSVYFWCAKGESAEKLGGLEAVDRSAGCKPALRRRRYDWLRGLRTRRLAPGAAPAPALRSITKPGFDRI